MSHNKKHKILVVNKMKKYVCVCLSFKNYIRHKATSCAFL